MKVIEIFDSIDGEQDNVQHLYALQAVTYAVRTAIRFIHCSVKKHHVNILK